MDMYCAICRWIRGGPESDPFICLSGYLRRYRGTARLADSQYPVVPPDDGRHIMHSYSACIFILADCQNGEEAMKTGHIIFSVALALVSVQSCASSISDSDRSAPVTQLTAGVSAAPVRVSGRPFGFVTCGKGMTVPGSLGCQDFGAEGAPVIPYTAWPGYRLGAALPASYRITAVTYDSRNSIATIYFEY